MQVFIIDTPLYTASILDKKRLHKQVVECKQIMNALEGKTNAWVNHPAVLQYKNDIEWLKRYMMCLISYREGDMQNAIKYSYHANLYTPEWHSNEYYIQMRRRLYTKDSNYYKYFEKFGTSDVNWYFVNNEWRYYQNGKQLKNYNIL